MSKEEELPSIQNQNQQTTDSDEDDEETELDRIVKDTGCVQQYWAMDKCLDRTGHKWTECQKEVREFKRCWDTGDIKKEKLLRSLLYQKMMSSSKHQKQQQN